MIPLALLLTSCLITLVVIPGFIRLARRSGFVDHPAHRKQHAEAVPYLGGAAILLGALPGVLFLFFQERYDAAALHKLSWLLAVAVASSLLGLWDDWRPLRGRHKLVGQVLIALPFVLFGFRFDILDVPTMEPIALGLWSIPLTLVWILVVCNAVNLIDGVDGLAVTVLVAVVVAAALCAHVLHDNVTYLLCFAVLGALLAFLRFNWAPARIYLGDSGSLSLGTFVAALLIAVAKESSVYGGGLPNQGRYFFEYRLQLVTLVVLYPLLEIGLSVLRRAVKGKAIGSADSDHIHHCLQRAGWSPPQICAAAGLVTFLGGTAAAAAVRGYDALSAVSIMAASLSAGVVLHVCGYPEQFFPSRIRRTRASFQMCHHFAALQLLKLEAARDLVEVRLLLDQVCQELGVGRLELRGRLRGGDQLVHRWAARTDGGAQNSAIESFRLPGGDWEALWWLLSDGCSQDLETEYRLHVHEFILRVLERLGAADDSERKRFATARGEDVGRGDAAVMGCRTLAERAGR